MKTKDSEQIIVELDDRIAQLKTEREQLAHALDNITRCISMLVVQDEERNIGLSVPVLLSLKSAAAANRWPLDMLNKQEAAQLTGKPHRHSAGCYRSSHLNIGVAWEAICGLLEGEPEPGGDR